MYKELVLKLNKGRPVFESGMYLCMYDSGAIFPVKSSDTIAGVYNFTQAVETMNTF